MTKVKNFLLKITRSNFWGFIFFSILVFAIISIFVNPVFFGGVNVANVLKGAGLYIAIGIAQMVVMAVGQFSLAIGSIGCFSSMVAIYLVEDYSWHVIPAFIVMFVIGILLGGFQGVLITKVKMQPFIVTLSLQYVYQGLALALFSGRIFNAVPSFIVQLNSSGPIKIDGAPIPPWTFVIPFCLVVIMYFVYKNTVSGKNFLAVGTSVKAAEIAGLKPQSVILKAHILSGAFACLGAIVAMSRSSTAAADLGADWILYSMACPVIGGTSLSGGNVNVFGLVGGAIFLQTLMIGLTYLQVNVYWTRVILGILLVLAFSLDYIRKYIAERSARKVSIEMLKDEKRIENNSVSEE